MPSVRIEPPQVSRDRVRASADGEADGEHPQQAEGHGAAGQPGGRRGPGSVRQGQDHDAGKGFGGGGGGAGMTSRAVLCC